MFSCLFRMLRLPVPPHVTQTLRSQVQVRSVGDALGAPVLDLWTALQQEPGWEALLEDGLHFTTAGQRAVHAALLRCIAERLPHLRCARLGP
jgi:lysophospholipase L1-like esterase